jgi:outer membrane protein assembly factor BamB
MNRPRWICFWGVFLALVFPAVAADWPQYRGPNHDGSSPENLRTNWAQSPPRVVWRKTVSPAWSSISVSGGRAFTQGNRRIQGSSREVCIALNADTGAELWATPLDQAFYPGGGTGSNDGPRSTPTVEGDRVYVFTSYLKLFCLNAGTGAVLWSRDFVTEFPGTSVIEWQNAASPLLVGDLLYLNSNVSGQRLTALRKSDGTTAWSGQSDRMTHATPTYATIAGTPQVVFLTANGLVGVTPDTGSVLWRYVFSPSSTSTAATPVVAHDYVYGSCAYSQGAWTARISRTGNSFEAGLTDFKRSSSYQNHWATPVHHNGFLYSVVERSFRSLACFDLEGRTNRWITSTVGSGNPGYASLIKVGNHLLVLTEPGELVLLEPNPAAYTEVARFQALNGTSWNHPAFSRGRIYARSDTEMVVLDVALPVQPLPSLHLTATLLQDIGRLRMRVSALDSSPLTASEANRIELQWSPPPGPGALNWQSAPVDFQAQGNALEAEMPVPAASTYLRIAERTQP